MAVVTTYVCDVTGKSGTEKTDFVDVEIKAQSYERRSEAYVSALPAKYIKKLVHIDVANKLGLVDPPKDQPTQPEVTFEGKLKALLEDFVQGVVEANLENR
jgi:hypothetical protein